MTQVLPLSQKLVKYLQTEDGPQLQSLRGIVLTTQLTNLSSFEDIPDHSYLLLERLEKDVYRILKLATPKSVLHEVYSIAESRGLDFSFPEPVEEELAKIKAEKISFEGLIDYSSLPFVTVDGAETTDLDQALYVEHKRDSSYSTEVGCEYIVWYAIADPTHFLKVGNPIYEEALLRGTSTYFSGMSAPMLPRALSSGIISLNEGVDRRCLLFIMQINAKGKCTKTDLVRAKIRSFAKLSTEELEVFYQSPQGHRLSNMPYTASLFAFKEVALLRKKEARERNVVQFNRVSLDVGIDDLGENFTLDFDERGEVSLYNEQLSLLCNMEGAKLLLKIQAKDPDVLAVFRNHEAPSPDDIADLEVSINALVEVHGLKDSWHWRRREQSLADYLEALPESHESHERYYRLRQAIERQVLMMQRRSVFSPTAGLHSALGVNPYARFSAPMREIVGVFTHKEAIEGLDIEPYSLSFEENRQLRARVIEAANRAKDKQSLVSKAIDSRAIAHVISQDYDIPENERPIRKGTILGMKASALYVRLDAPPIELKVYVKDIESNFNDSFSLNASKTVLESKESAIRFVVGEDIGLRVKTYNETKDKWSVVPVI